MALTVTCSMCGYAFTPLYDKSVDAHCPKCGEPTIPTLTVTQRNTAADKATKIRVK